MDYIARLNHALDEQEIYDDMEENGMCVIDSKLACKKCDICFNDRED